jgi:hypothetical protein
MSEYRGPRRLWPVWDFWPVRKTADFLIWFAG